MDFFKDKKLINNTYNISFCLLLSMFLIFMFSSVGFIINLSVNPFYIYLSIVISLITLYFLNKKENLNYLIPFLFIIFIIFISVDIAQLFYDFSIDGREYHQSGIFFLKEGWNPIYENIVDFYNKNIDKNLFFYPDKDNAFWLEHYVKFSEILAANIYSITGKIESGKAINLLFAVSSFLSCLFVFNKFGKSTYYNFIISFLLVINPVCIYQQFTFMNDNLLYYSFLMFLCGIIINEKEKNFSIKNFLFVVFAGTILVNIKFNGVYLLFVSSLIYLIYLAYRRKNSKKKYFIRMLLVILFFVVLSGINPYLTNVLQNKHVLYPFCGEGKIEVLSHTIPLCFEDKIPLEKLFYSTFSKTGFLKDTYCLKFPFTINSQERPFVMEYMIFSGFGYFWSGILLLSLLFIALKSFCFERKEDKRIFILVVSIILFSVFLNPESWYARYAPQFWIFPLWIFYFSFDSSKKNIMLILTILLVFLNCAIIEWHHMYSAKIYTNQVKKLQISRCENEEMFVLKFVENNIPYNVKSFNFTNNNK